MGVRQLAVWRNSILAFLKRKIGDALPLVTWKRAMVVGISVFALCLIIHFAFRSPEIAITILAVWTIITIPLALLQGWKVPPEEAKPVHMPFRPGVSTKDLWKQMDEEEEQKRRNERSRGAYA
ncbi:MAG TPA: hypothetical protein VMU07_04320 [Candidatus Paceibacterota bacterium]|nr:hypothetical protein [Candidatus Paceibacterota bacterium]